MEINIGERLKEIRIKNNLTQEGLGEHLFLTRQTISKWETGKSVPDLENLILLSKLYQVSLDQLVGLESLDYSSEKIKKSNQRKERNFMLTKAAKIFCLAVASVFFIFYGTAVHKEHALQNSPLYEGSIKIFSVENVEYEIENPKEGERSGKIVSITLKSGQKIDRPKYEDIKKMDITKAYRYLNSNYSSASLQIKDFND
ncbi:helix-turn-helix transcriptional regulator [Enterococcus alcedinis]|uniref:HTH cro/C1-type domain-containing protein n=1 Tax=Enterococcus alcedinis TaxID=1274384 RepID=A0A917N745_9ENTE|nr:helix-turn-helix transcriptional regulator [Enterococcus alcedinis]MBP2102964.1 transcriptional regulator with XRE-family HTH domain [Enterococcus alcedinis]GGI66562.1 hypothetical protein GCM10011482_22160 [Enterococcus alcedinis]